MAGNGMAIAEYLDGGTSLGFQLTGIPAWLFEHTEKNNRVYPSYGHAEQAQRCVEETLAKIEQTKAGIVYFNGHAISQFAPAEYAFEVGHTVRWNLARKMQRCMASYYIGNPRDTEYRVVDLDEQIISITRIK